MQKLLLAALFLAQIAQAQTVAIKIELLEKDKAPIVGATVKLAERLDTGNVQFAISDIAGMVKFQAKVEQQYLLEATYTGMAPLIKGLHVRKSASVYQFFMEEDATALAAVTIKATKPLMRQEDDMTIVDPGPIAETSTSAYEILEKTPGLFLDQDGNVYLSSTTPATIYINGREQKMSREDLASLLKNLPPNSIERLEILRTPSAKYDASGSGGIVNVVLKKGVKIGRTGSLNAGMNQGRFGNQFAGLSLNNSDGGRNSTVNLNYSHRNSYDHLLTTRLLSPDSSLVQDAYTSSPGQSLFANYGLGFELQPQWTLDFDGRANLGINNSATRTQNQIVDAPNTSVVSDNLNELHNNGQSISFSQGIATKYKLDTLGSELTGDLSYDFRQGSNSQDFTLLSRMPPSTTTLGGLGDIRDLRHSFSAQIDLKHKFPYKITFEAGAKTALQKFDNKTEYKTVVNGAENPDPFRTNAFNYKEAIHAAYLQGSKAFGQFILKAGLRMESTNMFGHQRVPADTSFNIQRADFFPYVYLSRRLMKIAGYELRGYLVYRKSINRPAYSYLNPFPRFLDQYLYESGNPGLRPQFTENYEANISFEERPILAIGRNYTQDIFTNVVYQDPNLPGVAYRTYDNLGRNEETYFKAVGALPPGGKYFFVAGAQYNYNKYKGLYQNEPYTFNRGTWSFFTYHQLKLDKLSQITLFGFYRLKGQMQFYELSDFGSVNLSINREFLDRKLVLTLSLRDVFFTNNNKFSLDQGSITAFGERYSDTRRFGLNLRYSFGFKRKEEKGGGFDLNSFDKSGG